MSWRCKLFGHKSEKVEHKLYASRHKCKRCGKTGRRIEGAAVRGIPRIKWD